MIIKKLKNVLAYAALSLGIFVGAISMDALEVQAAEPVVTFDVQEDGSMKYFEDGEWISDKYGYVSYGDGKFLVAYGYLASGISGLAQDPDKPEDWYYLANGQAQTQYTGLAEYDGAWFYVSEGKLDTTINDCIEYDGGLFYVAAGRIVKEKSGLGQDPNGTEWYYFADGQAQLQYTGLAEYDGEWFYVEDGIFRSDYTGTVEYDGAAFIVKNGQVVGLDPYFNNYPKVDMFADPYDIKGMQGAYTAEQGKFGGLSHSLINVHLDECIFDPNGEYVKRGWVDVYEFEGETFYFRNDPMGLDCVPQCNESGMSISVVFLLRWNDGSRDPLHTGNNFIIDEASREPGYLYYAPNVDLSTYGGRAVRAFWHYLMEYLESEGYHIDNFILGNEVNMPNQWHYSASTNVNTVATKYADAFYYMYEAVREYTDVSRCSISIDHSWNHNDEGRGIGARDFLHVFNNRLNHFNPDVDWCVSAHLYPAILYETEIWEHIYGLTTNSSSTAMVDGTNLSAMTNYIRDTWGAEHRVMLTEQGFSNYRGERAQAASLAYSYYAAMYDPMVDCFLISVENAGDKLDFRLEGTLAGEVYTKIGNGNEADQQWIADICLPVIGVDSWEEIIPNFGR